jgi:capsular polysaccharide transport system permease protein
MAPLPPPVLPPPTAPALRPAARPSRRWRLARSVAALVMREMATTYGRSPGGYLWAVLEPVAALAVLSVVFALVLRAPSLGNSFPLFYASAYLPFMLFNDMANRMATAIRFSRPLLSYPAVSFVDSLLARLLLALLTHLLVGAIILTGILTLMDTHALLNLPRLLGGVALAVAMGIGVGAVNCYLMTAFPVWERAWQILTRPLFLISGVIYIYEDLPRMAQAVLWWNPLLHVTGITRTGVYSTYEAQYASVLFVAVVATVTLALGMLLLYRFNRDLMED